MYFDNPEDFANKMLQDLADVHEIEKGKVPLPSVVVEEQEEVIGAIREETKLCNEWEDRKRLLLLKS